MPGPESFRTRWSDAVRPLPGAESPSAQAVAHRRRQVRLLSYTFALIVLGCIGYYGYDYFANAPVRAREAFDQGMTNMRPGAYSDAIDLFTRSIDISPTIPDAFLNRGIALHTTGQRDAALEDLARAIEFDPNLTAAYDERGRIYLENKDPERAVKEFSKSIQIRPTTDGYYQRGLLYASLGQHQKAIDDYDKAIAEMPNAPYAFRARAAAKAGLGDAAGAQQDRDAAAKMDEFR